MAFTITLSDSRRTIEITSDLAIDSEDPKIADAVIRLAAFYILVPLSSLIVLRDAVNTNKFDYSFQTKDGRDWHQAVFVSAAGEPSFSFRVPGRFRRSEITSHLLILDSIVEIIRAFQVVKIECKYL